MKIITEYQIINHGVQNEQYFQGCGVSFTRFTDVSTGIGESACVAMEDALESLAQNDYDVSSIVNDLSNELTVEEDQADCYHYVSVRVR